MSGRPHLQALGDPSKGHGRLSTEELRDPNFFEGSFGVLTEVSLRPFEARQFPGHDLFGLFFGGLVKLGSDEICAGH